MRLRVATLKDLDALVSLERICFQYDAFNRRQLRYLLAKAKSKTYVIEVVNDQGLLQTVAYALLLMSAGRSLTRLYSIAVEVAFQGQGFGRALIEQVQSFSIRQGFQGVVLEVRATDLQTQALYQRLGFNPKQRLEHYYADGSAGIRMMWTPLSAG